MKRYFEIRHRKFLLFDNRFIFGTITQSAKVPPLFLTPGKKGGYLKETKTRTRKQFPKTIPLFDKAQGARKKFMRKLPFQFSVGERKSPIARTKIYFAI